ncbi:MAG: hypothetical protein AVDCRST_MAG57-697, partial [uncultured Blastococcus sp.]
ATRNCHRPSRPGRDPHVRPAGRRERHRPAGGRLDPDDRRRTGHRARAGRLGAAVAAPGELDRGLRRAGRRPGPAEHHRRDLL